MLDLDPSSFESHNVPSINYGITTTPSRTAFVVTGGPGNHSTFSTTGVWDTVPFKSNVTVPRSNLFVGVPSPGSPHPGGV